MDIHQSHHNLLGQLRHPSKIDDEAKLDQGPVTKGENCTDNADAATVYNKKDNSARNDWTEEAAENYGCFKRIDFIFKGDFRIDSR